MKKLLNAAIILCITFCLGACGNQNNSLDMEGLGEETQIEETVTQQSNKTLSRFFEEDTLVDETINDVQFKLPKSWMEDIKINQNWHYYYFNELMVGINSREEYQLTNENVIENTDKIVQGMLGENGELISKRVIEVSGVKAIECEFSGMIKEELYDYKIICFVYNYNWYSLGFLIKSNSQIDYSNDFEKFKGSITILENEEKSKVEEERRESDEYVEVQDGGKIEEVYTPTTGEKNALKSAKDYLGLMAFSYQGLVEQLEYEKYSHDEAVYAADNCGADWNEQAAKSAKNYLELMSFSKDGLIEQLEYEGFTHEQAVYGAEANGY